MNKTIRGVMVREVGMERERERERGRGKGACEWRALRSIDDHEPPQDVPRQLQR